MRRFDPIEVGIFGGCVGGGVSGGLLLGPWGLIGGMAIGTVMGFALGWRQWEL